MGVYGRNAWWLTPPEPSDRRGRYVLGDDILIFSCVTAGTDLDDNGQRELQQAAQNTPPKLGKHGILIYENPFGTAPGFDPVQYAFGDFDTAPVGQPAQLVSGRGLKFRLKNTAEEVVQGQRTYAARKMVAGLGGATPTVAVDDFIGPKTSPTDATGWWQECTEANAWAIVTAVYDTDELDAELVF
jgi:hypothetical protein